MSKSTGRVRGLASLVVAGLLGTAGIVYADATITVGNGSGSAGGTGTFNVTLSTGGAMVAGTSNDITFDATNTPLSVATSGPGTCSVTTTKSCLKSSECPSGETCTLTNGPACTTTLTNKNALFSFLKTAGCDNVATMCACTPGTDCTAMRALIAGLDQPDNTAIPDGSTLYTCTVNIPAATALGMYPLTISNVQAADINAAPVTVTGASAQFSVVVPGTMYTVCDVNNDTGDNAGQFGDGTVDIFDVRAIFNAGSLGVDVPANGSARFSAMDSSTPDTPPSCGGDQTLDIFDVRQCFAVGSLGATNFVRTGTGASCTSTQAP